ncbi:aspartic peptidase domain-containing protein [Mycena sp. CBHHK59/15]|nr:aspartic peptidase domain-containing protein [Mycena sp. CBHHK59/15]
MFLKVFRTCLLLIAVAAEQQSFRLPLSRVPRLGQSLLNIAVDNSQEYTYIVTVFIGDQPFDVVLDTGSSDLWVASTVCEEPDCLAVPRYSPAASSTLVQTGIPFTLDYLEGAVTGEIAYDTVSLGAYQVQSQIFALAATTAALGLASTATSGILGLCFPSTAAIPATAGVTLLENLLSSISEPENRFFAFHLGRDSGRDDPSSSFTIGVLDPVLAPDSDQITVSNVSRTGPAYDYWKLPLLRLTLAGSPFALSRSRVPGAQTPIAVLDSGTTVVLGPTADVDALYLLLGPAARKSPSGWQVLCTRAVLLGFVLGDPASAREYVLDPTDVAWAEGASPDGWCTGGVQPNDGVNAGDWLLGDVFLRNVYTVHYTEPPRIGLTNATDPAHALVAFRAERGLDPSADGDVVPETDGWDTDSGYVKRGAHGESGNASRFLGAVAGVVGFVVGGMGTLGWRIWRGV